jgi:hypothetical protein
MFPVVPLTLTIVDLSRELTLKREEERAEGREERRSRSRTGRKRVRDCMVIGKT